MTTQSNIPNNHRAKRSAMAVTPHNRKSKASAHKKQAAHKYARRLMKRDLWHSVRG